MAVMVVYLGNDSDICGDGVAGEDGDIVGGS